MNKLIHDAKARFEIAELRNMLATNGIDNYTHAICEIALDGELSPDSLDGLTEEEYKRLVSKYQDVGEAFGWRRELAAQDALDAALTE